MAVIDQIHSLAEIEGALPKTFVREVFDQVKDTSAIQKVAGRTPMSISGANFVTPVRNAVAGVVGEGQAKPVVKNSQNFKTVKPIKLAAIMVRSKEQRMIDSIAALDSFQEDLSIAIQRSLDAAVIYGQDALTGNRIDGVEALNDTTNRVTLGTTAKTDGSTYGDIIAGYNLVTDAGHDFTGFVADNRARSLMLGAVDANGRPIFDRDFDLSRRMGTIMGLPVSFSKDVSGGVGAVPNGNLRLIGGDFEDNLKLGFAETITFSKSNEATIMIDGEWVSLWQNNLEAYLAEAIVGWVIKDPDAFVAYEAAGAGA